MELTILRNYQQAPHMIMKNQEENKNRNNPFYSHEFAHLTADLIGPLYYIYI